MTECDLCGDEAQVRYTDDEGTTKVCEDCERAVQRVSGFDILNYLADTLEDHSLDELIESLRKVSSERESMSKRSKDEDKLFPEDQDTGYFLRIQEVGGKVAGSNPRGGGRGSAKGKVETIESYPIDEVPEEYEHFLEKMKDRIEKVLERMEE